MNRGNQHQKPERPINNQSNHDEREHRQDQHRRQNPRLVYSNPDDFFSDLLMEQEEQG